MFSDDLLHIRLLILWAAVFIIGANIYAQDSACGRKYLVSDIVIEGNKTTKTKVIERELTLAKGDSVCADILPDLLLESRTNLEKAPLFNFVTITTDTINPAELRVHVKVEERWYFIPLFTLTYADRNLNNWLKNKDWSRIKIGGGFEKYNFRGHNENLGSFVLFGYDEQLSLFYRNIYFDEMRKHGASFYLKYYKRKETPYGIVDDKYAQIKLEEGHAMHAFRLTGEYFYRVKPGEQHTFGIEYEMRNISDTVMSLNSEYATGITDKSQYIYLSYTYDKDTRDSRVFPMSGYKLHFLAQQTGLGFFPESNINFFYVQPQVTNHFRFAKRFSLGNRIMGKKSFGGSQPFYLQYALGTEYNIRGYEYYVINGQDFILNNNSLNFELLPKTIFTIKYLPFEKFNKIHLSIFLGTFWDMAYVRNTETVYAQNNQLANTFLYSGGLSLNLLTYYDKLLRFDYSWNKLGERHLFFHIIAPF